MNEPFTHRRCYLLQNGRLPNDCPSTRHRTVVQSPIGVLAVVISDLPCWLTGGFTVRQCICVRGESSEQAQELSGPGPSRSGSAKEILMQHSHWRGNRAVLAAVGLLLTAMNCLAQESRGSITGKVTDP